MDIGKTLDVASREEWRRWLTDNHQSEKEIWLFLYKKASPQRPITYSEAVDEATCYGWIDSQSKSMDERKYAQRFSPRQKNSYWSEPNKARALKMLREGRMAPAGLAALPADVIEGWNKQG